MAEEQGNGGQGQDTWNGPASTDGEETEASEAGEGSEETSASEQGGPDAAKSAIRRGRGGLWLGLLALLVALVVGGAGGYGYWLFEKRFAQVEERLAAAERERQSEREAVAELRNALEGVRGELQSVQGDQQGLADRLAKIDDQLGTLRDATKDLYARLEGGPTYWRLERVESLLLAADRVARLEGDAQAAHAALAEADRMLRDLNDPAWLNVREAIQKAMTHLEQVPDVDVAGIAFRLASLTEAALDLPLKGNEAPSLGPEPPEAEVEPPPEGVWGRIKAALGQFWTDIKGLVRLKRSGEEVEPLLPPDQAAFLRHNLVLNLQAARLALLRERPAVYRQSLGSARDWVERFFDGESDEVAGMIAALKELQDRSLAADLPELHEPLQALRQARQERQD
ncbi:uroporphyrinogen-III C-methyltransferase [Thiohalorhabdus sp.]|uniref:uroporphyrinogen-III C-methyltransferase n=1 Tax=Thiohalorhabdus sp. TaxID=3094134 RepID=UPI002FC3638E